MNRELPSSPWAEWKIIEKIGEGAYGRVYKAERTEKGHSFYSAIKVISIPSGKEELNSVITETGDEASARAYFENVMEECIQEICTMEYFHGNSYVVSVEDFKVVEYLDEIGWEIYIRMEYLTSFLEFCAGRNFGEKEVIRLGIDLCRALCYCKKLNIIHRDIKPENIFVSRFGDFKLGDFGIAREMQQSNDHFSKKGTYSYMAPELYRGETYDDRADIYALGLVLYKLLNHNRLPFLSLDKQLITYHDKENALNQRMSGETFPPAADAGEDLNAILAKACAYNKEDRYANAAEFLKELEMLRSMRRRQTAAAKEPSFKEEKKTVRKVPKKAAKKEDKEPKESREVRKKRRREEKEAHSAEHVIKSTAPWIIAIILVAAASIIFTGIYMKKMLADTVAQQTEQMVSQIQNTSNVSTKSKSADFSDSLEMISDRVTEIVDEIEDYAEVGNKGEVLSYYDGDQLRKVLVYPEASEEGMYEEYFYWNENLIFAYIWKGDTMNLYYYRDGILIRWIDEDGNTHDNELDNENYIERGDKYWNNSIIYR